MGPSWLVCVTHHPGLAIILGSIVIVLNFYYKEFRFGLHADSLVLVDILHVLESTEGRFTSAPNVLEQTLFCGNYSFINPS